MAKLTREQKIEIYSRRKNGETAINLSKIYNIRLSNVNYLISLIDYHGIDILRVYKNRYFSPELKTEIINCVLIEHNSIYETSLKYGLSSTGILVNWIKKFKEMGYNMVEKPRGRTTMKKQKSINPNDKNALLKQKDQEILYLKAENEYLKKLHAVIQAKEKQQQKKK